MNYVPQFGFTTKKLPTMPVLVASQDPQSGICKPDRLLGEFAARVRRHLNCRAAVIRIVSPHAELFCAHARDREHLGHLPVQLCAMAADPSTPLSPAAQADSALLADPLAAADLGFGFYAGLPLRLASGEALGTLAALDAGTRELSARDLATMTMLAAFVAQIAEFRLASAARGAAGAAG